MVWFRLTPEEYEQLREFCIASGTRSISDLSRSAVTQFIAMSADPKHEPLTGEMRRLQTRIQLLIKRMEELSDLLHVIQPVQAAAHAAVDR